MADESRLIDDATTSGLVGRKVAILATNGVEEIELVKPRDALKTAGAETTLVSLKADPIQAMEADVNAAGKYEVDAVVANVTSDQFDALLLPGGTTSPDHLRIDDAAVRFVSGFVKSGKPIAAICHGPWTLINAGGIAGRRLTSWPSLEADIVNAGGEWVDETLVIDGPLVTSRNPDDLEAFCPAIVRHFAAT